MSRPEANCNNELFGYGGSIGIDAQAVRERATRLVVRFGYRGTGEKVTMIAYILHRLAQAPLTLFFVSVVIFLIMWLTPGDPAQAMLGNVYGATPETIAAVRKEIGLDKPLPVQYAQWLGGLAHGDFGQSYISHATVRSLIVKRFPATLELAFMSSLLALLIAIPAGVLSAVRRGTWVDHLVTTFVTAGIALPGFFLAILMILFFSVVLKWVPSSGYVPIQENVRENLHLVLLPATTLAILVAAPTMRFVRSGMLDVLNQDYVRTARAKGLIERIVIGRHALGNALIPTVTWVGLQFAYLIGGSVMVEWVFGWPGLGWLTVRAVLSRDYLVVQSTVVTVAMIFILVNLAVDILYAVIDPRVRYGGGA